MKVAMVCNYSDRSIRTNLSLNNLKFSNFLHHTILRRGRFNYMDYAPWNKCIIQNAEIRDDWELHVISSQFGMRRNTQEFELNGVFYHCYVKEKAFPVNYIMRCLEKLPGFSVRTAFSYIVNFIRDIKPDVVILVGAENDSFVGLAQMFTDIPVFVLCQTMIANSGVEKQNANLCRAEELNIFSTNYVGVYCNKHFKQLQLTGYKGHILEFQWPLPPVRNTLSHYNGPKVYDFINFAARASEDKGYSDSVKALSIVKKKYPSVTLNLKVDEGTAKDELINLVESLGLQDNISYTPSFATSDELMLHVQKSRFGVLPCKLDNYSGTMMQCMTYGIPIVVYKTEGTISFNEERPSALVAEMNNVEDLADKMIMLMSSESLGQELAMGGKCFIEKDLKDRQSAMDKLILAVQAIYDNFHYGTVIREQLLYKV